MKRPIQIQRNADGETFNLYVDGVLMVESETMQVCDNIKQALQGRSLSIDGMDEAAEVAAAIVKRLDELDDIAWARESLRASLPKMPADDKAKIMADLPHTVQKELRD